MKLLQILALGVSSIELPRVNSLKKRSTEEGKIIYSIYISYLYFLVLNHLPRMSRDTQDYDDEDVDPEFDLRGESPLMTDEQIAASEQLYNSYVGEPNIQNTPFKVKQSSFHKKLPRKISKIQMITQISSQWIPSFPKFSTTNETIPSLCRKKSASEPTEPRKSSHDSSTETQLASQRTPPHQTFSLTFMTRSMRKALFSAKR
jgi:hypothetical protein